MNSPHICHVISGKNEGGGIERHVKDLTEELAAIYQVSVIADPSMEAMFADSIRFVPVDFLRSRRNLFLTMELRRKILALAPDCVHVHGRKAASLIGRINRFMRIPSVITIHNLSPSTKECKRFDAVIGVSGVITANISHPVKFTIYNGRTR
ncbi:MAG: glycosyltransferase family 4 protein [Gammaproteobacteria bacterium]|nr:glycosyltransferase family 4 protein [Gammaproteobacteria bacterium]